MYILYMIQDRRCVSVGDVTFHPALFGILTPVYTCEVSEKPSSRSMADPAVQRIGGRPGGLVRWG